MKIKLTNCCDAYSTYVDDILCCKKCYNTVSEGEGDGTKYIEYVVTDCKTSIEAKKDILKKIDFAEKDKPFGVYYDVSDDFSKPIYEAVFFDTKEESEAFYRIIKKEQEDKFNQ